MQLNAPTEQSYKLLDWNLAMPVYLITWLDQVFFDKQINQIAVIKLNVRRVVYKVNVRFLQNTITGLWFSDFLKYW